MGPWNSGGTSWQSVFYWLQTWACCVLDAHGFFKAQRALQETQARGLVEGQVQGPSPEVLVRQVQGRPRGAAFSAGTQKSQQSTLGGTLCSVKSELSPACKHLQTEGFW